MARDLMRERLRIRRNNMVRRCHNPNVPDFPRYGGLGITVCDRWRKSLDAFIQDMGPMPDGYQIDRIDSSGNYEPGNCRWVPMHINQRNKRSTRFVVFEGVKVRLVELCERFDVCVTGVHKRLDRGASVEDALTRPGLRPYRRCAICGIPCRKCRRCSERASSISQPPHPADAPPPSSVPASPAPLSDSDNEPAAIPTPTPNPAKPRRRLSACVGQL